MRMSTRPTSPATITIGWIQRPPRSRGRRISTIAHATRHRGEEADADDEQLEDAEHPGDDDRHDPGADGHPALPRDRSHCAIGTGTASNTSPIASLGERWALRSARIMMRWPSVASPTAFTSSGVA